MSHRKPHYGAAKFVESSNGSVSNDGHRKPLDGSSYRPLDRAVKPGYTKRDQHKPNSYFTRSSPLHPVHDPQKYDRYTSSSSLVRSSTVPRPPITDQSSSSDIFTAVDWSYKHSPAWDSQGHRLSPTGGLLHDKSISQLEKPSYRVTYDPEIKKDESKGKSRIIKTHSKDHVIKSKDPRLYTSSKVSAPSSQRDKKLCVKNLLHPRPQYDEDSIGPPPPTEILIYNLGHSWNEVYLKNQVRHYGEILEYQNIIDETAGVKLGIVKVRFGGETNRAFKSARKAAENLNDFLMEGKSIKAILLRNNQTLVDLKLKEIGKRHSSIKKSELDTRKIIPPAAPKAILNAISKKQQNPRMSSNETNRKGHEKNTASKPKDNQSLKSSSSFDKNKENNANGPSSSVEVPFDLQRLIKGRPYIFIRDELISNKIDRSDIKKRLEPYDWTRVLGGETGVYVVFNELEAAKRCFAAENGKQMLGVTIEMMLQLPRVTDDHDIIHNNSIPHSQDIIEDAATSLAKELEYGLQKDIRTKIIAPAVIDFLSIENFPAVKTKLEEASKFSKQSLSSKSETNPTEVTNHNLKAVDHKSPNLPSFRKKYEELSVMSEKKRGLKKSELTKKRDALPLSYSLNYQGENNIMDHKELTPESEKGFDDQTYAGPPRKKIKKVEKSLRLTPLLYSSSDEDNEDETKSNGVSTKESIPTTPEVDDDGDELMQIRNIEPCKVEITDLERQQDQDEVLEDVDYTGFDKNHCPIASDVPLPVYREASGMLLNLDGMIGLIKDEEDFAIMKTLVDQHEAFKEINLPIDYWSWKQKDMGSTNTHALLPQIPKSLENITNSQRSEGYSKIVDAMKVEYLPHRKRVHDPLNTIQVEHEEGESSSKVQSSRVNRANNRRFAYEVSNFNTENEILTMNQLNKRKKPVSFARSAIHNWGLYALEPIAEREMIIEYVGERIRQQVADFREKAYLKSGIGSSYLFRIDENTVIDATKKGGIARFINHSCVPSCTAKIIKVEGEKRIVIYALRDIGTNEELTYDYKFERETNDNERVRCLCGAPGCKGYLN